MFEVLTSKIFIMIKMSKIINIVNPNASDTAKDILDNLKEHAEKVKAILDEIGTLTIPNAPKLGLKKPESI